MTDAMIVTRNLFVTLPSQAGAVNIIRGIDLSITSGETVGLIGPSGSGKSTLLMVLAGLEPASRAGDCFGPGLCQMDEDALSRFRRSNVGIVFQSFHLVPTMTAVENVALPLELAGVASAFEKAETMLEEVGLGHRLTHYPAQMSGGEQQRTALARALVANPPVLFADEPTGNLDQNTGRQIMDLILRLAEERGTTVLLITHDRALADRCARVETMQDGRLFVGLRQGVIMAVSGSARLGWGLALRLARREMRHGFSGFRIFFLCLVLGISTISAVGSLSASMVAGMAAQGQAILGGDMDFRLVHREASDAERHGWMNRPIVTHGNHARHGAP